MANPNRNNHQKKKNGNYKGYGAAQQAKRAGDISRRHKRQPLWVTLTLIGIFAVLVVLLILMNTTFKGDGIFAQVATIIIGISCGGIVWLQRYEKSGKLTGIRKGLYIALTVMAVVYTFMGAYGLFTLLK